MKPIEYKGETEFHLFIDMNCEVLDLNEQVDLNPGSNSLMISKVTQ